MKTFPLNSDEGQLVGFEVSHSFISSGSIARFVRRVKGCEVIGTRRWFSADEIHVRFSFSGHIFIVWEPFGDKGRPKGQVLNREILFAKQLRQYPVPVVVSIFVSVKPFRSP